MSTWEVLGWVCMAWVALPLVGVLAGVGFVAWLEWRLGR